MKELRKSSDKKPKKDFNNYKKAQEKTEKTLRELSKNLKESNRELSKSLDETNRELTKNLNESNQELTKNLNESNQELTKNLNAANGNFNNKWGKFLESLVKGDLVKLLSKRNIKVDMVRSRLVAYGPNGQELGEFDLVAVNGKEIVAVEVKTALTKAKVKKSIDQLKMFRKYFPEYGDKVVYGGVAFLCEPEDEAARGAAKYAEENGLFVILSPGGEGDFSTMSNSKDFKPKAF